MARMETFKPPFTQGGYGRRRRRTRRRRPIRRRRRQRGRGILSKLKSGIRSKMGRSAINAACKAAQGYANADY